VRAAQLPGAVLAAAAFCAGDADLRCRWRDVRCRHPGHEGEGIQAAGALDIGGWFLYPGWAAKQAALGGCGRVGDRYPGMGYPDTAFRPRCVR
jgi:hypothetical protein